MRTKNVLKKYGQGQKRLGEKWGRPKIPLILAFAGRKKLLCQPHKLYLNYNQIIIYQEV